MISDDSELQRYEFLASPAIRLCLFMQGSARERIGSEPSIPAIPAIPAIIL